MLESPDPVAESVDVRPAAKLEGLHLGRHSAGRDEDHLHLVVAAAEALLGLRWLPAAEPDLRESGRMEDHPWLQARQNLRSRRLRIESRARRKGEGRLGRDGGRGRAREECNRDQ
jgi:hypothetical protein